GADHAQGYSDGFSEMPGLFHVGASERRRIGEDGEHAAAENAMGGGGEEGRIDSAGIGHQQVAESGKAGLEVAQARMRFRWNGREIGCRHASDYSRANVAASGRREFGGT